MNNWKDETRQHIREVKNLLDKFSACLEDRGIIHDKSKLREPEAGIFKEYTSKLRGSTYGSEEYKKFLGEMKPALDHHYKENRHHPEHFDNGIGDMTLIDLIEMFCDWKAATLRHKNGDMLRSIRLNKDRFGMSGQLVKIFKNTNKEI